MKSTRALAVLLGILAVLMATWSAVARELTDLEAEARQVIVSLTSPGKTLQQPQKAGVLYDAAVILAEENMAEEAFGLYKKALRLGKAVDRQVWQRLAETSYAARQWPEASQFAFLAYNPDDPRDRQLQLLWLMGQALENRNSWQGDWKPAALAVYERLLGLDDAPEVIKRIELLRKALEEEQGLRVRKVFSRSDMDKPAICLTFNDMIADGKRIEYGDYIRIKPAYKTVFTNDGYDLCAMGAEFGTSYEVVVRKGLDVGGRTVTETAAFTVETGHRPPAVWFDSMNYVLPRAVRTGIALYTVNTAEVRLQLYRIHERNILSEFVQRQFRQKLDGDELQRIGDSIGEPVWQSSSSITGPMDEIHTSSLSLPDDILDIPGVYVLTAMDSTAEISRWQGWATQWLVVTDIGLTSYTGADGLTVVARSLKTARPISGQEITLFARNNKPLATITTSSEGRALFAPGLLQGKGGQQAVMVSAAGSMHGFSFLQLNEQQFDLSDRGVSGRPAAGPLDGYVYTDRGIYRPGEKVHAVMLLRDNLGKAVAGLPLTLRLLGPDGDPVVEEVLQPDSSGAYTSSLSLSSSARTGDWAVALYVDVEERPVAEAHFQVEAFVPPRLEVALTGGGVLRAGEETHVLLAADYLFGAPAAELPIRATLRLDYAPHPFSEYPDFHFGRAGESVRLPEVELDESRTDASGGSRILCRLDGEVDTLQPLQATVRAMVMDVDGREVSAVTTLPVRQLETYIGVKPGFAGDRVEADSRASFQVLVLSGSGDALPGSPVYSRFVREDVDYQWFRKDGSWGYERIVHDRELARQDLRTDSAGLAELLVPVASGDYRLEVFGPEKVLLTSIRFSAGEQIVGRGNTPDAVRVELDHPQYRAGDVASLRISSPYPGEASLVLASDRIHSITNFRLTSSDHTLQIPVSGEWGGGVYAMVTVYRPGADAAEGAGRAVGLIWLSVDPYEQRLSLDMELPARVWPKQTIEVPVRVRGGTPGEEIRLTLSAVDEGVLQLTNYKAPDPLDHFFGQKRLGTEIRDLYGRLISTGEEKPLALRQGAGDDARRGAPEGNIRVVSLFSGIVAVDREGVAMVALPLPDFNGRLRLMAVAWSRQKLGSASGQLPVSEPLVVAPSMPRFLARGDQSVVNLLLQNIDGPEGEYQITLNADGAVKLPGETGASLVINHGERHTLDFTVMAASLGNGQVGVEVSGPEGYRSGGSYPLNVRGRSLPLHTRTYRRLLPGEELMVSAALLDGLYAETATVDVSLSSSVNFDVAGILAELDRYPYGCLEQLTSRAMPLLSANELAARWQYPLDPELRGRVMEAIELLLQKQRYDGGFGLWSSESPEEPWLSAYAMDFLQRARAKGFRVSDYFYQKGLRWLKDRVESGVDPDAKELSALAYVHYVLARMGQGKAEDARYLYETFLDKFTSRLGVAHLAGALALQGDRSRAVLGFAHALAMEKRAQADGHYDSQLRDVAGVIAVLHESGGDLADPAELWQSLIALQAGQDYLSTQEQAWLVQAALTLGKGEPLQLNVDGRARDTVSSTERFHWDTAGLSTGTTLRNTGRGEIWVVVTVQGTPEDPLPPMAEQFQVRRQWYTQAGKLIETANLRQGDLVVAVVSGEVTSGQQHQAMIIDLLPAGLEFEKAVSEENNRFYWLPELSPIDYADGLDDRFIAAFDTAGLMEKKGLRRFVTAYVLRAVSPGTYSVPPVEVESMYRPRFRARTSPSAVTVHTYGR